MLQSHGIKKSCTEETLHVAGPEGVRRHSGNHADQNDGLEVRQQFHAREDNLAELAAVPAASSRCASFWHRAFGLRIQSNLALSGLPRCDPSDIADIRVHLHSREK